MYIVYITQLQNIYKACWTSQHETIIIFIGHHCVPNKYNMFWTSQILYINKKMYIWVFFGWLILFSYNDWREVNTSPWFYYSVYFINNYINKIIPIDQQSRPECNKIWNPVTGGGINRCFFFLNIFFLPNRNVPFQKIGLWSVHFFV